MSETKRDLSHEEAIARIGQLERELTRLRDINFELVRTHNTLVVENARQEQAIWKFSNDPRAAAFNGRLLSEIEHDEAAKDAEVAWERRLEGR